ncbi:MAG: S8 family serine peptidase [bacterium]|nr:S8 family serine peptidase [bacterium]
MSGTSMAGPHVAGVVALMREANPNADVREIKSVLMQTAIDYNSAGDDNTSGHGFIDAYEAVLLISADRGWLFGQITNAANGQPISGARVQAGDNYIRFSDSQGNYRISLPADSLLPLEITAFGYAAFDTMVSVADSDTVYVDFDLTAVASGTINGVVVIGSDIPVEGAVITPLEIPVGPMETNEAGEFSYTLPGNNTYDFTLEFQDITLDTSFTIAVGQVLNAVIHLESPHSDVTGPDNYGYRAYERYDDGLAAQYDWDPMVGATDVNMPDIQNVSAFVEMPFPFVFYGHSYDSITINENGWVAPGEDPDRRSGNTFIPNIAGPSGMLAVYWDDLDLLVSPFSTHIWTKYDQTAGKFIIEYDNVPFALDPDARLSAQIHIFDQEVWPTPTGDCEIMFVYSDVGYIDAATVGIEKWNESDGLQLRFNGVYEETMFDIREGEAVMFTTRTGPRTTGNLTGTITTHPALSGPMTNGVKLGNVLANVQANGTFSMSNVFAGPRTLRVQMAGYERAMASVTIQTNQTANVNAEVWRLDPPSNLHFDRTTDSVFLYWNPPVSLTGLDDLNEYSVHLDSFVLATTTNQHFHTRIPSGEDGHFFWLTAIYDGGESVSTDTIHVTLLGADEMGALPREFALSPAYPNPFNPTTSLEVALPQSAALTLRVFDIAGREVSVLASGQFNAGVHRFTFDAAGLATGVYFARAESSLGTQVQKLLLLK